jgi:hypothetical protein
MSLGQAVVATFSERELRRLRVLIDLSDDRLTVEAAGTLMGLGRRQVYRLRRAFAAEGPTAVVSRKRGRAGNHRYGETFQSGTACTWALRPCGNGMIADGLWVDRRHRLPSPHQPRRHRECLGELVQIGSRAADIVQGRD